MEPVETKIIVSMDSHFEIGHMHVADKLPCQDYALTKSNLNGYIAAISDGCSACKDADIGSRIVALSMAKALLANKSIPTEESQEMFGDSTLNFYLRLESFLLDFTMGDDIDMLFATFIAAVYFRGSQHVDILMQGDGVVTTVWESGVQETDVLSWELGMPPYPAYKIKHDALKSLVERYTKLNKGGKLSSYIAKDLVEEFPVSIQTGLASTGLRLEIPLMRENGDRLKTVMVFSDGVETHAPVDIGTMGHILRPTAEVAMDYANIKNFSGEFIKRRHTVIKKNWRDRHFLDDFSVAAMHFSYEEITDGIKFDGVPA